MWQRHAARWPHAALIASRRSCSTGQRLLMGSLPTALRVPSPSTALTLQHAGLLSMRTNVSVAQRSACGHAVYPCVHMRHASGGAASGGGRRIEEYMLNGRMLLQTARVALETRDADKIRGAKVRARNFLSPPSTTAHACNSCAKPTSTTANAHLFCLVCCFKTCAFFSPVLTNARIGSSSWTQSCGTAVLHRRRCAPTS